jgi:hypothetical protein
MIGGIVDLTELQHAIEELQGIKRVKPRTASLDDAHRLLEEGYTTKYISKMTGIPESAIVKEEEERRKFLSTGKLPSDYRVHTAFSGTSWTNYY